MFPAVPFLPIGRTAGSLLGAMLMVLFGVISADEAYAAVDLPILGLLFDAMVVSVYLERADMFKHLGRLLSWRSQGGKDLLLRTCAVSALASALFTNDTCCVVLTEFILKIARQNNLPPKPFLLALASSANIGSAATPIGNPQNLVIAVQSGISFGQFVFGILPATLVGAVGAGGVEDLRLGGLERGERWGRGDGDRVRREREGGGVEAEEAEPSLSITIKATVPPACVKPSRSASRRRSPTSRASSSASSGSPSHLRL